KKRRRTSSASPWLAPPSLTCHRARMPPVLYSCVQPHQVPVLSPVVQCVLCLKQPALTMCCLNPWVRQTPSTLCVQQSKPCVSWKAQKRSQLVADCQLMKLRQHSCCGPSLKIAQSVPSRRQVHRNV